VRLNLALMSLDVITQYPIIGYGVGGGEAFCEANNYQTFGVCTLHNWPLELATSFGVPIAIFHLVAVAGVSILVVKAARSRKDNMAPTIIAMLSSTLAANFTASSILLLFPVWIFLGICVAYVQITDTNVVNYATRRAI